MTIYRREFKKIVENEIMRNDAIIESLIKLIKITINLNDKLYKRAMKKRYQNSRKKINIYFKLSNEYRDKKRQFVKQATTSNNQEIMSMKLNFIQRSKKKNLKKKNNEKKCYLCDKLNHFAKKYQLKNMMSCRQINTLLKILKAREIREKKNN